MKISIKDGVSIAQLLILRGSGVLSLFLVNVFVARHYGAATLGLFQVGLAWVIIASTVARCGQDQLILRLAAEAKASQALASLHETLYSSLCLVASSLSVGTAAVVVCLYFVFADAQTQDALRFLLIMTLAILPMGLLMVTTEAMRGWQNINQSVMLQGALPAVLAMVFIIAVATLFNGSNVFVALGYVLAFWTSCLAALFLWSRTVEKFRIKTTFKKMSELFWAAKDFWLYAILTAVIAWIDVILLDVLSDEKTIGEYSAIVRTGAILGTLVQIISAGAVAQLALYFAQSDYAAFAARFRNYFHLFGVLVVPIAILAFLFPREIMSLWGESYKEADGLFLIYAGFQLLNFALCLTGFSVAVMKLERQLIVVQIICCLLKVVLIAAGYQWFGLSGALWGSGISLLAFNVCTGYIFWKCLQKHGVSFSTLFLWPSSPR